MSSNENIRNELWKQFNINKSREIREKLITEYSYLVKYVAGRLGIYFGSIVEYDDLISYGILGLIDAIDKFDINKGVKFDTYASLRIRGAIIDGIRELDWIPRTLRQKNKEIEKAYAEIELKEGRPATDKEVADYMGISVDNLNDILNSINASSIISLEDYLEQNYEIGVRVESDSKEGIPEYKAEFNELKEILANAIDKLPEKEKMVVSLYYFEELTLKEISAIMKVTESRISQLHTKAIMRLRGKLTRHRQLMEA